MTTTTDTAAKIILIAMTALEAQAMDILDTIATERAALREAIDKGLLPKDLEEVL